MSEHSRLAFKAGYEWANATQQSHRAFIAQIAMAGVLNEMGRPEEGQAMLAPALADSGAGQNPDSRLHALLIAADSQQLLGNLDLAMQIVQSGVPLARQMGSQRRSLELELKRLQIENAMGGYNSLPATQILVDTLRSGGKSELLQPALNLLARIQASNGNYAQAYELTREVSEAEFDAMRSTDHRKLALLEVTNQLGRSEREKLVAQAAARELQASAERNRLMGVMGGLFFLFAIAIALFDHLRRRERQQGLAYLANSAQLEAKVAERTRELEDNMVQRMRAEEERRGLEQELAQSERMRSLGQLTGGVAHDFNNLLTVVTAAAELLEENPNKPIDERHKLLQAILGAAKSGREINTGLLAYARRQQLTPEPIVLDSFLQGARLIFQQTLGEGMRLHIKSEPLTILADHGQLMTAVMNLLTNAREASAGRGDVYITVSPSTESDKDLACLSIRDTGRGMTKQETARAVEPFYSTKQGTLASGLGLSRVYGFVQQSGGIVKIDSQVGKGTNILLEFPVHTGEPSTAALGKATTTEGIRVMLVDDNPDVRHLVQKMLETLGHVVTTSDNGEHAKQALQTLPVDLLVTDVLMPGKLSGSDLANSVKTLLPELPILMISGFAEAPDLDFPLLSKPFSLAELDEAIQSVMV